MQDRARSRPTRLAFAQTISCINGHSMSLTRLADLTRLFEQPEHQLFCQEFESLLGVPLLASQKEELRTIGAAAFELFLKRSPAPDDETLRWFMRMCSDGWIKANGAIERALLRLERRMRREAERKRYGAFDSATTILQTRRVVQMSWFGTAGFCSSDAFEIRRSIYSARQERQFAAAARLRFPGLSVLPNYPLRQVVDLDKVKRMIPPSIVRYGFKCLLDVLVATPREGDPIAAIELDSRSHDDEVRQRQDEWKAQLLQVANIPLFRLRSEDPASTSIDEWYSVLTDQVVDHLDCGARIRTRDSHETLVPLFR